MNRKFAGIVAVLATAGLQGCAAILASNEPQRNGLIGQVRQGMTLEEVRAVMGPPDETMAFGRTQTRSWDYRYTDSWGYTALFSVVFAADGRVASTFSRRLNGRADSGRP